MKNVKPQPPADDAPETAPANAPTPVVPAPVVSPNPGQILEEPGTPGGDS
jgi:hypothetical protein